MIYTSILLASLYLCLNNVVYTGLYEDSPSLSDEGHQAVVCLFRLPKQMDEIEFQRIFKIYICAKSVAHRTKHSDLFSLKRKYRSQDLTTDIDPYCPQSSMNVNEAKLHLGNVFFSALVCV